MCMIDDCDEIVNMLSAVIVKARKAHKCMECNRLIHSGEHYYKECYVFDNDLRGHKTCGHCKVARNWLTDECGGFVYGEICQDLIDHVSEGYEYPYGVYRITVGMKNKWQRRDGSLLNVPNTPLTTHERMKAAEEKV